MSEVINIPDENFRKCILQILNKPSDYQITKEDCESILEIYCYNSKIKSLEGIEYFINLDYFLCAKNQLVSLDLSNNIKLRKLNCSNNKLTSLDLSNSINLECLDCYNNQLTNLDVSNNIELTELFCYNNQLTSLDLSKNIKLTYLSCYNNQLTNLKLNKKINYTRHYKAIIINFNNLTIVI